MARRVDRPIHRIEQDTLGRAPLAERFADQVVAVDHSDGLVVGVLGKWGSGKTSFINMAMRRFRSLGAEVVEFNPWMFSGSGELVSSFFSEISSQMREKSAIEDAGAAIGEYGKLLSGLSWLPVVGQWIGGAKDLADAAAILMRGDTSTASHRKRIVQLLREANRPVLVILDDIDRLTADEIRNVFKLVRLTASFPNIIYLLAFDRTRVEAALNDDGLSGRGYLEKIVQMAYDLPKAPAEALNSEILRSLEETVEAHESPGPLDEGVWADVFHEIIRPLISTMRDLRRFDLAVDGTLETLDGQVALADALALEAVRIFLPDVFQGLSREIDCLTLSQRSLRTTKRDEERRRSAADTLVKAAGTDARRQRVVRSVLERLFPAAGRLLETGGWGAVRPSPASAGPWLRDRRVAHTDILRLYLERIAGSAFSAFLEAEQAVSLLTDASALEASLRTLDPSIVEDVVASLEHFEDSFEPDHVESAAALLNVLQDLPSRPRGMLGFDTELVFRRVAYRLLRTLEDDADAESTVLKVLGKIPTLTARLQLVSLVGHRENEGHQLVSKTTARALEADWRSEVRNRPLDELAKERNLFRVMLIASRGASENHENFSVPDDSAITLSILASAATETISQSFGSSTIQRTPRLHWKEVLEVFRDEETTARRLDVLESERPEASEDPTVKLARRYLSGEDAGGPLKPRK